MEKDEFKIVRPFGPSVVLAKIPPNTIKVLNNYIDTLIGDEEKIKQLDHGNKLVGDVTQEFKLEEEILQKSGWRDFLKNSVSKWIEIEMKKKITKFNLIDSWIVRQFENEYNPTHWHSGHLSGAGFLKVPPTLGKHYQKKNKNYKGGQLQLINGTRLFLSPSTVSLVPKVGDFYFFPNYLMHTVFPFKGTNEERRSISFNASIDENIYDVYGGN
ncbi:2OG-Fe(II) oxygenase family protein [Candidatus Pelagibacter sp.]|nr:2OG-Fe(II) oxygenase family protein [Candidatus Pelagibacter sp.]